MNKIKNAFSGPGGKAFIPYIACGDPDLETTKQIVLAMAKSGADLIELGIPFSDPTAEGPVIMEASARALAAGTTTDKVFGLVKDLRKETETPLAFMTYANVLFSYGSEAFVRRCAELGVDALIIPDVPYEERDEFEPYCRKYQVALVPLIAPTSRERIAKIAREAEGFIYIVSSLGVTGVRSEITTDIASMVKAIRENSSLPCAVGFGIQTPQQARRMASLSDGAIVGSAIVKIIAQYGADAAGPVADYVKSMADAVHGI